jgi:hypothetical protein
MKDVMKDLNKLDPAVYAAQLADEIAEIQLDIDMANPDYREDWWKEVLGHTNRLLKTHYAHLAVDPIPQPQAKPSEYRPIDEAATAATGAPWKTQPSPWHKSPKVVSAPPSRASSPTYIKNWKPQPPGSVIPDEVKLPGMESERFKLLEWRHNGFESRLQELEKQIESLSAAHESLHNTCWKQSHDIGSRLEVLESRFGRMDFYCEAHSDHHDAISKRLEVLEQKAPR